jgi:hypothetical protein
VWVNKRYEWCGHELESTIAKRLRFSSKPLLFDRNDDISRATSENETKLKPKTQNAKPFKTKSPNKLGIPLNKIHPLWSATGNIIFPSIEISPLDSIPQMTYRNYLLFQNKRASMRPA